MATGFANGASNWIGNGCKLDGDRHNVVLGLRNDIKTRPKVKMHCVNWLVIDESHMVTIQSLACSNFGLECSF